MVSENRKWDGVTIFTHWIMASSVILLLITGFGADLAEEALGKSVEEAIHYLHYFLGLALICGVAMRVAWGFVGDESVRWSGLVKGAPFYSRWVKAEIRFLLKGEDSEERKKTGHNPIAIPVYFMALAVFALQAYTGLQLWDSFKKESAAKVFVRIEFGPASVYAASDGHGDRVSWGDFDEEGRRDGEKKLEKLYEELHEFGLVWWPLFLIIHLGGLFLHRFRGEDGVCGSMVPF